MGHIYERLLAAFGRNVVNRAGGRIGQGSNVANAMKILTFIERSNAAETSEKLMILFQAAALDLGYTKIAYLGIKGDATKDISVVDNDLRPLIACNYPKQYLLHYRDKGYIDCDPALIKALRLDVPYSWHDVEREGRATRKQQMLWSDGRAAGLHNGVTVPLHASLGRSYAVCLARDNLEAGNDQRHFSDLHILATQFHHAYLRVARSQPGDGQIPTLSDRERECLTWTAAGKSAWEIGMILALSEQTVSAYTKSAMKKLNVCNRVAAVVQAMQYGLIAP
jgi:DNA-binding CsgD family transcriptional regulator